MKEKELRIPIDKNFGIGLGKILKDYKIKSQQISEDIGKNRTYVSHITLGKIKQLPFSVIDDLIRAISERATEGHSLNEEEEIKQKICFEIKEMLPGSLTNITYETLLFRRTPFYNKDFIKGIITDLENMNYSPYEFITKVVNPKGSLEILGYKKKPELFECNYDSNYLSNLLLDTKDEYHQLTNYKEMFLLVYRFFELSQSNDRENFRENIKNFVSVSDISNELSDEMFLKEAVYAILFRVEYYTFEEVLNDFNRDPEMRKIAEAQFSINKVLSSEEKAKVPVVNEIQHSLSSLASFFENPDFLNIVNNNLNYSYHFIYEIFKKDYTKIQGRDNEFGFLAGLNKLYEEWANKNK